MIYQVDHEKQAVSIQNIENEHMYIGMMTLDELKDCHHYFGISQDLLGDVRKHHH